MSLPHQFPTLINGPAQVVLIAGSGLSAPTVPMLGELRPILEKMAEKYSVSTSSIPEDKNYEYELAGVILDKISLSASDSEARIKFADELGILDDRRWVGDIDLPISGNTPRHRAIAKFAVEKRLKAIISLNYDSLLEAALDSVGMNEGGSAPSPWEGTTYARIIDESHMPLVSSGNVFVIVKPHGCVKELRELRGKLRKGESISNATFKLTTNDLNKLTDEQKQIFDTTARPHFAASPLIGVGWKASEPYLLNAVCKQAKTAKFKQIDACTVVDICWNENHDVLVDSYSKSKEESFVKVEKTIRPTTDTLFLWLYAQYALNRMHLMSSTAEREKIDEIIAGLDKIDESYSLLDWIDKWLSVWIRLCWRAGSMKGIDPDTGKVIEPFDIPITPRDAHIPLKGISLERKDLQSSVKLLLAIKKHIDRFNFEIFPGGLFDSENRFLFVTVPGWKDSDYPSDLAALKPMCEAISERGLGYVTKIYLVCLHVEEKAPNDALMDSLKSQFCNLMPLINFASEQNVQWIQLEELIDRLNE